MAGAFSFGFNDDDIEDDQQDQGLAQHNPSDAVEHDGPSLVEPTLATLPSAISYTPGSTNNSDGSSTAPLPPRRELFDIRTQLMAEEDAAHPDETLTAGLSSDIKPRVYEGGFKTWECSVDLARYVQRQLANGSLPLDSHDLHVIELGAGTAVPSAALVADILHRSAHQAAANTPSPSQSPAVHLTLADYNAQVLQLATLPNILLAALSPSLTGPASTSAITPDVTPDASADADTLPDASEVDPASHDNDTGGSDDEPGELDTTSAAAQAFPALLAQRNVHLRAISGAWGEGFVQLARLPAASNSPNNDNNNNGGTAPPTRPRLTLVLASETIYAPESLPAFCQTLRGLLSSAGGGGAGSDGAGGGNGGSHAATALVAAKKVYFGVGGGVEEFLREAERHGLGVRKVWDSDEEGQAAGGEGARGVGRCILGVSVLG